MKKTLLTLLAAAITFAGLGLAASDVQAKRLGGGSSFGMSRNTTAPSQQAVPPKPASPAQQAAPSPATNPAAAAAQTGKRSWLGPVAGLAAGLGLAALASHLGFGEEMASFLMILLLVGGAFFLFRMLTRTRQPQSQLRYAGAGAPGSEPLRFDARNLGSGGTVSAAIPAGFDVEGFLRQAKLNFVRLQAANDRGEMDDIRSFTTPEVFAEIQMQYEERGRAPQRTEVLELEASLLEVVTEDQHHVASVRFHGRLREERDAAPIGFDEIWHLTKPADGSRGWAVAGIQQVA
jgi:predicted lipid-binding transport protein (Tim44 family)